MKQKMQIQQQQQQQQKQQQQKQQRYAKRYKLQFMACKFHKSNSLIMLFTT